MKILLAKGMQILDSRGNPTIRARVILEDGSNGEFDVPSGASTGIHEAHELRDNDKNNFNGKSVENAVKNIQYISTQIEGKTYTQEELDKKLIQLDGTQNKELLGANAILGVSVAFAKASAQYYNLPLHEYLHRLAFEKNITQKKKQPQPNIPLFANVINGGLHAGNKLQFQEFMIIPNYSTNKQNIHAITTTYQALKSLIGSKYGSESTAVGDEGGFAPQISTPEEALDLLTQAVTQAGVKEQIYFALDVAASDIYNKKTKKYKIKEKESFSSTELVQYYTQLIQKYPIISIEDPFSEDDFEGFAYFMKNLPKLKYTNPLRAHLSKSQSNLPLIVGDDLLVTNPQRIKTAQQKKLCNALLLKINQIGTLTESLEAFSLTEKAGWNTIVSHRSGETIDSFIADLAYALNSSIKLGSPARGERVAKYNRLISIMK